jgi:hypothetical protein
MKKSGVFRYIRIVSFRTVSCGRMFRLNARSPHPSPSLFQSTCVSPVQLTDGRGGRACSQIMRPQNNLGHYKSFNPLWKGLTKIGDFVFSAVAFGRLAECS